MFKLRDVANWQCARIMHRVKKIRLNFTPPRLETTAAFVRLAGEYHRRQTRERVCWRITAMNPLASVTLL